MKAHGVLFCLSLILTLPSLAYAYEVDNFTDRQILKTDSLPKLDQKINWILDRAALETREEFGKYCNRVKLRQEVLRWIRPDPTGQLEIWIELSGELERTQVGLKKSIYQDIGFLISPILRTVGIGRSILVNGHVIGSDKIGHFFYQGLSYYDLVQEGKPLDKVLAEDHHEDGIWGLKTSGVYSYADKATNYQGYRFWKNFTTGDSPYFKCDADKGWVRARDFTWADYVNDAWDEAINCSDYRDALRAKVEKHLVENHFQCPMSPAKCVSISKLDHASFFTSPKCLTAASLSLR